MRCVCDNIENDLDGPHIVDGRTINIIVTGRSKPCLERLEQNVSKFAYLKLKKKKNDSDSTDWLCQ